MAGDWLKMTHALPEKPEVLAISGKTGLNRFEVVGRLFILWRWFDNNTVDGNAAGVTSVTLNDCLFGYGDATAFVSAVVAEKWLTETTEGISVVKFDEHTSESAKQRAQTAKRVAKSKKNVKGNDDVYDEVTPPALPTALPREEIEKKVIPPNPPKGAAAVSLKTWAEQTRAVGKKLIPEDDPVFVYAAEVGIPDDFIALAWSEFKHRYGQEGAKRYKDWRVVFRKAVRGNWFKLWYLDGNSYSLTTVGHQASRTKEAA